MATWEDGPEYAPRERPQYFADAPLPPLEQAPPVERPADGLPTARPRFDQPSAPVAPLATLVPEPPDERDPHRPFDVVTATLTSGPAWGPAAPPPAPVQPLGPTPAGPPPGFAAPPVTTGQPGRSAAPVPGAPWPVLEAPPGPVAPGPVPPGPVPPGPHGAQPPGPYDYPSPGTPQWFAPPPATYGDEHQPGRVDAKAVVEGVTPGLLICLAVGGLILPLAPVAVVLAVFLSTRVRVAERVVRNVVRGAASAVAFFAVVGLFRSVVAGDPWWSFVSGWSAAICWVLLVVLLLVVWQALSRPRPPTAPPPTTNPWG